MKKPNSITNIENINVTVKYGHYSIEELKIIHQALNTYADWLEKQIITFGNIDNTFEQNRLLETNRLTEHTRTVINLVEPIERTYKNK